VFDPDNNRYYIAIPSMMEGDLYLNPVYYDKYTDPNATTDVEYGLTVSTYHKRNDSAVFQQMIANQEYTGKPVIINAGMAEGDNFRVEMTVFRRGKDMSHIGGETTYTLYFYKNHASERDVPMTNDLDARVRSTGAICAAIWIPSPARPSGSW